MSVGIPGARTPLVDANGRMTTPWYRFFYDVYQRTGGASDAVAAAQAAAVNAQASANLMGASISGGTDVVTGDGSETENTVTSSTSSVVLTPQSAAGQIRFSGSGRVRIYGSVNFTGETLTITLSGTTSGVIATKTVTSNATLSGFGGEPDIVTYNFSFSEYDSPGVVTAQTYIVQTALTGGHSVTLTLQNMSLTATELAS